VVSSGLDAYNSKLKTQNQKLGVLMRYDDPNVPVSAVVGIISAVLLFVVIIGLQAVFFSMEKSEIDRKVTSRSYDALERLRAGQLEQLNSYGWVSEPDGVVHVPIERAMEIVVAEGQAR
jgi:hypothetical protein